MPKEPACPEAAAAMIAAAGNQLAVICFWRPLNATSDYLREALDGPRGAAEEKRGTHLIFVDAQRMPSLKQTYDIDRLPAFAFVIQGVVVSEPFMPDLSKQDLRRAEQQLFGLIRDLRELHVVSRFAGTPHRLGSSSSSEETKTRSGRRPNPWAQEGWMPGQGNKNTSDAKKARKAKKNKK